MEDCPVFTAIPLGSATEGWEGLFSPQAANQQQLKMAKQIAFKLNISVPLFLFKGRAELFHVAGLVVN